MEENKEPEEKIFNVVELKALEGFIQPKKSTEDAAAYDVFVARDTVLKYGTQLIPLGFAMAMPPNIKANIRSKSGYTLGGLPVHTPATKEITNVKDLPRIDAIVHLGLVDADYRGEVNAILEVNNPIVESGQVWLQRGQQIAQMEFSEVPNIRFQMTIELPASSRDKKGFGEADNEGVRNNNN